MRVLELLEEISKQDLRDIERTIRPGYRDFGLDPDLSGNHFYDRVNDERNKPSISKDELKDVLKKPLEPPAIVAKRIAQKDPGSEILLSDPKSKLNIPFIIKKDPKHPEEKDMVAKTIMRKSDFKTDSTPSQERLSTGLTPDQIRKLKILGLL